MTIISTNMLLSNRRLRSIAVASVLTLSATNAQSLEVGVAAPNCHLKQLSDGQELSLSHPGKVVYVDFWASWCGPCAQSMPFLESLKNQYQTQGLEVVGVNLDENKEDALAFLQKYPVKFTLAQNEDGQCPVSFDVQAMPSSYIIDRQGKVRHIQLGFHASETETVHQKLKQLLEEK